MTATASTIKDKIVFKIKVRNKALTEKLELIFRLEDEYNLFINKVYLYNLFTF